VLIFEVVGRNEVRFGDPVEPKADAHRLLKELFDTYRGVQPKNVQESYHDAKPGQGEAQSLFKYGYLSLRERAQVERLYWCCCEKIQLTLRRLNFVPEELKHLDRTLAAIYYCNFSLFQSAPDIWAIEHLFPIMAESIASTRSRRSRRRWPIHLRQRRHDRPLHRRRRRAKLTRRARAEGHRGLLPRHVPERRLPGNPRRPAQPVRRHARGSRRADGSTATTSAT
jgi:hypothetical protein